MGNVQRDNLVECVLHTCFVYVSSRVKAIVFDRHVLHQQRPQVIQVASLLEGSKTQDMDVPLSDVNGGGDNKRWLFGHGSAQN